MNITICERGCGRTSLDIDASIDRVIIVARVNGNEETSFKSSIEVCKYCRASIYNTLQDVCVARQLAIKVDAIGLPKGDSI